MPPRSGDHISSEKLDTISPNDLKGISVLFENDLYELARLMIKVHRAKDEEANRQSTGSRQAAMSTLNGLAQNYAYLTGMSSDRIKDVIRQAGLSLGACLKADTLRLL